MGGTARTLLALSLSSNLFALSRLSPAPKRFSLPKTTRVFVGFRPLCTTITPTTPTTSLAEPEQMKHSILLERLRLRHLKESAKPPQTRNPKSATAAGSENEDGSKKKKTGKRVVESFEELGLSEEAMGAVRELGIEVPTEIQSIGIPAVFEGKSVVLGSHTGSGKTLAYMLPLVQLLRRDEALFGMLTRPRRPRAVVLCPTRELSEQVFRVAKSIGHHARFRCTMVSGGGRLRPQEDSLNNPIDMVVGTPGRVLQHIEEGNIVYGDIKYLVLDEADTMFDRGFGPEIRKFLGPLKNRASKADSEGFQTILVTATMTKAVQNLIDEEFEGIVHLRTSTLHKKVASARHDFIKLSGSENKMEALLQVLEPSLAKGNRVMVFCNTLNSSRAVDHFLGENQISTVNYHGEVPAEQRNGKGLAQPLLLSEKKILEWRQLPVSTIGGWKPKVPSLVSIRQFVLVTGKVTSLVAKKDLLLATRIEEAMRKNESLESLTTDHVRRDVARARITGNKVMNAKSLKVSQQKNKVVVKGKKTSAPAKSTKPAVQVSKSIKSSTASTSRKPSSGGKKQTASRRSSSVQSTTTKLSVVGFRGRNSWTNKKGGTVSR
ncbi:hypothetical protein F2P56_033649 [Juglans regia]|uniref:DEAD-box ATP-dependent RNA helicase 39 n=1 Tax=Juglans regia TaxID=51240 RepID=A0A833U5N6_JUGRE|nr:hypothetical protein F2P56_033649 [Juglans regia]